MIFSMRILFHVRRDTYYNPLWTILTETPYSYLLRLFPLFSFQQVTTGSDEEDD